MVFGVEGQPLCERCSSSINIEDLLSPGWEYKGKISDVAQCAASCDLCSFVWKISQQPRKNWRLHGPSDYSLSNHPSSRTDSSSTRLAISVFRSDHIRISKTLDVFTNEKYILQELHGLPYIGVVGPSTSSRLSFDTARAWLRRCVDCHHSDYEGIPRQSQNFRRLFCDSTEKTWFGPSRMIDCFAGEPDIPSVGGPSSHDGSCKLVEFTGLDEPYAAHSYC